MNNIQNSMKPKLGPRDVFMQLLAIVTLYMSAIALGTLLFQFINLSFPDILADGYYFERAVRGSLRWALAMLVVVFPVYVWVSWFLGRETRTDPLKAELKTRKWLLNFTLFATAVIIIIDMVALVFRYLEGEFTIRFALKILVVLGIASAIFFYYLVNLRTRGGVRNRRVATFVYGVMGLVVISIVFGFIMAGSPQQERLRQFDERRIGDLQDIQRRVVNFWQSKDTLPENLSELEDSISGYLGAIDPETEKAYEYRRLSDLSFELCATFKTDSEDTLTPKAKRAVGSYEFSENWSHGIGRACFERTIDPDLYGEEFLMGPPVPVR